MARPRQFDEDAVLHAVRDQFWDGGYAATSLEDLMRVSGLGKGSLYAAFVDKHRLFLRALDGYVQAGHDTLRRMLATSPRAVDALRAFVTAAVSDPTGGAARRGCFLANSTSELATADPDVAAAVRSYDGTVALVAEGVARAQREGDVPGRHRAGRAGARAARRAAGHRVPGSQRHDIEQLTTAARSLAARLLPGH